MVEGSAALVVARSGRVVATACPLAVAVVYSVLPGFRDNALAVGAWLRDRCRRPGLCDVSLSVLDVVVGSTLEMPQWPPGRDPADVRQDSVAAAVALLGSCPVAEGCPRRFLVMKRAASSAMALGKPGLALAAGVQVAAACAAVRLHHGDLWPENVGVDAAGCPMVLDLELCTWEGRPEAGPGSLEATLGPVEAVMRYRLQTAAMLVVVYDAAERRVVAVRVPPGETAAAAVGAAAWRSARYIPLWDLAYFVACASLCWPDDPVCTAAFHAVFPEAQLAAAGVFAVATALDMGPADLCAAAFKFQIGGPERARALVGALVHVDALARVQRVVAAAPV
jgi:hypothetical protein